MAAAAGPQILVYQIEHPTYGNIGTYTNKVMHNGDAYEVQTEVHVGVNFLGISVFHQDANRAEHWEYGRLISFQGSTDDNGTKTKLNGKAQDGGFAIVSLSGTVTAPPQIHPSNPWARFVLDTDVMMSTKTGKVAKVVVTDTGETNFTFDGKTMKLHQFFIDSDKHQIVWFDDNGVVAGFQSQEDDGTRLNFVLTR